MNVAYVADDIYLEHDTGLSHPESRYRLEVIERAIVPLKNKLIGVSPVSVSEKVLELVHTPEHNRNSAGGKSTKQVHRFGYDLQ